MSTDLQAVEAFLNRNREAYEKLVADVKSHCTTVKDSVGIDTIYRIYSRSDKQYGELKDAAKILEKIEGKITDIAMCDFNDIVGVTVVVYYTDDIDKLLNAVENRLLKSSIRCIYPPKFHREGYYATHAIFRSSRAPHNNLRCEVQFKTLLHDAWSAKMHDLTYKPAGAMDARLAGLMGAVSSQIEGIEQQSLTIRNIIQGRHRLEVRAFQAYCDAVFDLGFSNDGDPDVDLSDPTSKNIWDRVNKLRDDALAGRTDLRAAQEVFNEIDASGEAVPFVRVGWILASRLASGLLFGDKSRDMAVQIDRFLAYAADNSSDPFLSPLILQAVPMAFYAAGDLSRAAQYSERIVTEFLDKNIDESQKAGFEFNRLTYLLELEHLKPSRSEVKRDQLKANIEKALQAPKLLENKRMASAKLDTEGLLLIVFGKSAEEIKSGITKCMQSAMIAPKEEQKLAEACLEWRLESGWRRYFDLSELR